MHIQAIKETLEKTEAIINIIDKNSSELNHSISDIIDDTNKKLEKISLLSNLKYAQEEMADLFLKQKLKELSIDDLTKECVDIINETIDILPYGSSTIYRFKYKSYYYTIIHECYLNDFIKEKYNSVLGFMYEPYEVFNLNKRNVLTSGYNYIFKHKEEELRLNPNLGNY